MIRAAIEAEEIKKFFKGEVAEDDKTLEQYSSDASLFFIKPQLFPRPKK